MTKCGTEFSCDRRVVAKTEVGKVEVVVDVKEPDPDRVFAQILPKWTARAHEREQAYIDLER